MTTANTVIDDKAMGIYMTGSSSAVFGYVATVPEPGGLPLAAAGMAILAGCVGTARLRRRRA